MDERHCQKDKRKVRERKKRGDRARERERAVTQLHKLNL